MQIKDGDYVEQTEREYFEYLENRLKETKPEASTQEDTIINGLLDGFSQTLSDLTESNIGEVYSAGYVLDASGRQLTKRAQELGYIRQEPVKATGFVEFSRENSATTDYTIPEGTVVETEDVEPIQFETSEEVILSQGTTNVQANITTLEGGVSGNVGSNTIVSMPSPPTGIASVTNPEPTGDPTVTDTDGNSLVNGQDRETDIELQNRVLLQDGSPESASSDDLEATISSIDDVIDTTAVVNAKNSTNKSLPAYSTEVVVQGGTVSEIVSTLFETMSMIDFRRLQAGNYGTEVTDTVQDRFTEETVTGRFSRPTIRDPDITIDIIVTDEFAGSDAAKDSIIEYTGGIDTGGTEFVGLTLGEDLYTERVRTAVTSVEGVRGTTAVTIDSDGDGTDDTSTDSDGLDVLTAAKTEVFFIQDSNVTINTTQA